MIEEENPYALPKSSDFRLLENAYQPTKGQKIARIVLGTLLVPLLMFLFAMLLGVDYRRTLDISFFVIVLVDFYFMTIVQCFLFSWALEKYCPSIEKKIICVFIFSMIIAIMIPFLAIDMSNPAPAFFHMMIGSFMTALPATMITALLLHAHYQYYKKKYFQAA